MQATEQAGSSRSETGKRVSETSRGVAMEEGYKKDGQRAVSLAEVFTEAVKGRCIMRPNG